MARTSPRALLPDVPGHTTNTRCYNPPEGVLAPAGDATRPSTATLEKEPMKITLRYFALWREELGREEEAREVAPGTTVGALIADVIVASPRLTALRPSTMFMVNQEYAHLGQQLAEGDEVAVIP